ncbi:MAG: type I-B CRISPR-associated protein Cas5b [bacterium]
MDYRFLAFDWKGYMAHFRQFDANSSSLSYSFPPPTVVCGMLAGVIGIEKDEYYDTFSRKNLQVGVQVVTSPRKLMQPVNYVFAKRANDLNMSGDNLHTQIPMELLISRAFPREPLHYRIFLKFTELSLAAQIENALHNTAYRYLPYLGSAPFTSWLEWIGAPESAEQVNTAEPAIVDTVAALSVIELRSLRMEAIDGVLPAIMREHVRREFLSGREPGSVLDVIWERNRGKIMARFVEPIYRFRFGDESFQVSFL